MEAFFALGIAARKPFCNQKALLRKARRRNRRNAQILKLFKTVNQSEALSLAKKLTTEIKNKKYAKR